MTPGLLVLTSSYLIVRVWLAPFVAASDVYEGLADVTDAPSTVAEISILRFLATRSRICCICFSLAPAFPSASGAARWLRSEQRPFSRRRGTVVTAPAHLLKCWTRKYRPPAAATIATACSGRISFIESDHPSAAALGRRAHGISNGPRLFTTCDPLQA